MGWLLELLIEGIREIFAQFIIDMMEVITGMFTELLSCDLSLFEELFSVVGDLYQNVMVPMGIAVLLLICVWQLFKSMFGRTGENSEDPIELVLRSCICLFFIAAARPVVNYILKFAGTPYQWLVGTEIKVESFSEYVSAMELASAGLGVDGLSIQVLLLIMQFVMAWNYFKMLFLIAERYVLLGVFSYTSPLAFSTGGAKATNHILGFWSKMFGGQIVLIILNAWCMKMFLSGFGNLMASRYGFTKFFVASLCLIGFCKIMFKLDTYMASLGINLGRPSGSNSPLGLMMAAGRLFSHSGGGAGGGKADGDSPAGGTDKENVFGGQGVSPPMPEGTGNPIPMGEEADAKGTGTMDTSQNDVELDRKDAQAENPGDVGSMPQNAETGNVLDELGVDASTLQGVDGMEADASTLQGVDGMEADGNMDDGIDLEGLKNGSSVMTEDMEDTNMADTEMELGNSDNIIGTEAVSADTIGEMENMDGHVAGENSQPIEGSTDMDIEGTVSGTPDMETGVDAEGSLSSRSYSSFDGTDGVGGSGESQMGDTGQPSTLAEMGENAAAEAGLSTSQSMSPEGFDNEIPSAMPDKEMGAAQNASGSPIAEITTGTVDGGARESQASMTGSVDRIRAFGTGGGAGESQASMTGSVDEIRTSGVGGGAGESLQPFESGSQGSTLTGSNSDGNQPELSGAPQGAISEAGAVPYRDNSLHSETGAAPYRADSLHMEHPDVRQATESPGDGSPPVQMEGRSIPGIPRSREELRQNQKKNRN